MLGTIKINRNCVCGHSSSKFKDFCFMEIPIIDSYDFYQCLQEEFFGTKISVER
jgi:hypothetical protein